ncbi:gamma carbonic anhydrase family protein [Deinococcus altitudinis]|uniref:gamma carbonic anhydrase family protein n=1 Tax=Deinococcus altitudinis TaxID=468914 RepID=UPI0038922022
MPLYALHEIPETHQATHAADAAGTAPRATVRPQVHASAFVAPSADLIGRVVLAAHSSVWFGAVLRGDTETITVGEGSNVQDGAVLHADPGFPCTLEAGVTVGHRATVHGATCAAGSLVGMGATMLNGSRLGVRAVLGAGALLPEGREVPDGMLAVGLPAKVVGPASGNGNPSSVGGNAERYVENAARFKAQLQLIGPQAATPAEPGS